MNKLTNEILSDQYTKLVIEDKNGEKIATITPEEVIVAGGYTVRLKPSKKENIADGLKVPEGEVSASRIKV